MLVPVWEKRFVIQKFNPASHLWIEGGRENVDSICVCSNRLENARRNGRGHETLGADVGHGTYTSKSVWNCLEVSAL